MSDAKTILIETIVFGISFIPFVYVAAYIAKLIVDKPTLPDVCSTWNENYIMEVNIFVAAVLMYLTFSLSGLKAWYKKTR